jgi:hypothetical protein
MTQHELILSWVDRYGKIVPAKMSGTAWNGGFYGSETPKRCRELRAKRILASCKDGKFEVFYRVDKELAGESEGVQIMQFNQGAMKF